MVLDNGKNYTAITDNDGLASFTLPALSDGVHNFNVGLVYFFTNQTHSVKVGKYSSSVAFNKKSVSFYYGSSGTVTLKNLVGCTVKRSDISIVGYNAKISFHLSGINVFLPI